MKKTFCNQFKLFLIEKKSSLVTKLLLTLFIVGVNFAVAEATQFRLFRTPTNGNTITLTTRAKIIRLTRNAKSYTIWRNRSAYITINQKYNVSGVLPPGNYTLRVSPRGSVTIYLDTQYRPQNIILWGRQHKLVKPLWQGNFVVLCAPTRIVKATYDGTKGIGIFRGRRAIFGARDRILYYLSPHNRPNPGPKVIGGTGGKTLVGQTLPPGVYMLVPGRGTADGIVSGQIVLNVR